MFRRKKFGYALIIVLAIFLFIPQTPLFSQKESEKEKEEEKTDELFKLSLEELMKIKITTAGKTEEKIADIPASVVLITREDIEMYGYRSLREILENIPGLFPIDDYAEGDVNFGVRGFWSGVPNDNIIILVNGVHQVSDFQSNYPLYKIPIPVESIDRIEVIRGPMSVIYGSGAFYGAINIFTNGTEIEAPVSIVSSSIGSEKTKKLFLRIAANNENFDYVFNASLYDTYGLDKPLSEMVRDPEILPAYGVPENRTTNGTFESTQKYFNFSGNYKAFYLNLNYVENDREFYFFMPSFSDGSRARITSVDISFGYKKELSDILSIDGKFTYSRVRVFQDYDFLFEDFYGNQQLVSNAFEVDLDVFIKPSSTLKITTGLYYRVVLDAWDLADLPSFGVPSIENRFRHIADGDEIVTRALFAQATYNPFDKLSLVAGVRLEQSPKYELERIQAIGAGPADKLSGIYDREKMEIIPRFAAVFYLSDDNIFKLLYGKAINRPSFIQNTFNTLDPLRDDLEPETIQTLELNYISSIKSNFTINASIFHNTLENLITRVLEIDESGNYISFSGNAGKMITNGIELTLNAELFENFRLGVSGTFQKTKDKRAGYENIEVAYSPKFLGYLKASYRTEKFTLAVTGNYVSSMETFWDELIGTGERIGDKVDGYFLLGANLRIEDLFLDGLYLNIRCSNLLDTEIRFPTFTNNQWATRGTLGHSRTFLVSLGYKF